MVKVALSRLPVLTSIVPYDIIILGSIFCGISCGLIYTTELSISACDVYGRIIIANNDSAKYFLNVNLPHKVSHPMVDLLFYYIYTYAIKICYSISDK